MRRNKTIAGERTQAVGQAGTELLDTPLPGRLFYVLAGLALVSVAISFAGKWLGDSVAAGGHTESQTVHEIVIGNNVLAVPANTIRFARARRDGIAQRLDLYLRWPGLKGYTPATRDDFNHMGGSRNIIFVSFEERAGTRDMSGRFSPIYRSLIAPDGRSGPAGLAIHPFREESAYTNEVLAVAERPDKEPFVARCLDEPAAGDSLAPCERDVHIGDGLSLTYRFPARLLAEWRAVDAAVMERTRNFLRTGR